MFHIGNRVSAPNEVEVMEQKTIKLGGFIFVFITRNSQNCIAKDLDFENINHLILWM